ncbi:lipid A-modifier LpxR family protein [Aureibacter tunicatorum]|uniref:Lipid A deacylase LpxR family protein n=1 Tax=Aureibacter tunicatorum TaxID=866807 RepID=A0AAE3XQZ4_9BACT|nr:lipid A-modifier LpxR family protein [Aureibacter tunicatorum]MDR6241055.1 hypothetical protein [Aureibacter tunicatorum]BDD03833.1 exonuclease [Aureibacter tunicatorum]
MFSFFKERIITLISVSLLALTASLSLNGQNKYHNEITITSDNDNYDFIRKDRYYTFGQSIGYNKLLSEQNKLKSIISFKLGVEAYTPYSKLYRKKRNYDRPYAGFSYLSVNYSQALSKKLVSIGLKLGAIGKHSYAENIQIATHALFGVHQPVGWHTQINNHVGLNIQGSISNELFRKSKVMIFNEINAEFGLLQNHIDVSPGVIIGRMEGLHNSSYFGTSLGANKDDFIESYWSFQIKGKLQFYDATINGSFYDDDSYLTRSPSQFVFKLKTGYTYSRNFISMSFLWTFQTPETNASEFHTYGSIRVKFRF